MNSVPTVTQKQCTESKTGLGAPSAHPGPTCAHRPRALRHIVAHSGSVSWPSTGRVADLPRSYRRVHAFAVPRTPLRAVLHVSQHPKPYRGALWSYRSPWLPCITTHGHPLSATIQFLYRDPTPNGQALARAQLALHGGRPYHGPLMVVSWRRLGRVVIESWPCHGPLAASRPAFPASMSRYKLLYRDLVHAENGQ